MRQSRGSKFPEAGAKITEDLDVLLEFYNYPADHWVRLRTTNPIKSTFATVQLRTKVTKRPESRVAGLAMTFKLIQAAQDRWRAVNAPHLVALDRAGATLHKGISSNDLSIRTPRSWSGRRSRSTGLTISCLSLAGLLSSLGISTRVSA